MPRLGSRWTENPDGSYSRRPPAASTVSAQPASGEGIGDVQEGVQESYPVPRTHAEADEQASARGVSWPREDMTVQEKQEHLAAL